MNRSAHATLATAVTVLTGCSWAGAANPAPAPDSVPLEVPPSGGPLAVRVFYPEPDAVIQARDSTFIYGTVGRGDAMLEVNGVEVPVLANGSWLAWLPLPDDSIATFALRASTGSDTVTDTTSFPLAGVRFPCVTCAWVDSTSFVPSGRVALPPDERLRVRVRATPGATVRLLLPASDTVTLVPDTLPDEPPWGVRAFAIDTNGERGAVTADRFVGWTQTARLVTGDSIPLVEVATAFDTLRQPWPVTVEPYPADSALVIVVNDDTAGLGETDSLTVGRALPGGSYHWFFPTGTPALVTGYWNGLLRLGLSHATAAWIDSADAQRLPPGTPSPAAVVGALRLVPESDRVVLRVALSGRVPFRIDEYERTLMVTLYGARADIDWVQYGETDSPVRALSWNQPARDEVTITVRLDAAVWGYAARWQGRDLLIDVRRPPPIDVEQPLRGRTILLDAGHPPGGSTGPSGQREPEVTLAVARIARDLLEARGARALLTRDADTAVSLIARVNMANRGHADALVSIHTNGLPDGVNPFVNNGTSTYYFHPRSLPLARAVNREIAAAFGTRDLGVGRGDLALARPTWLPAILVEGLFQMLPEHDGWLATHEGRRRYAQAIVDGLEAFFSQRAADP